MKQQILSQFPLPWLPTLALLIFFCFFVGLLINVSRKRNLTVYNQAAAMPLDEGERYE